MTKLSDAKNAIESNPNTKINDLDLKGLTLPTDGIKVENQLNQLNPLSKSILGQLNLNLL